jgi:hypothetical protein
MKKRSVFMAALLIAILWITSSEGANSAPLLLPGLAPAAPLGTGFTYQGLLKDSGGNPITNTCSFQFTLWYNLGPGGTQIGGISPATGVSVTNGYFTALVNASNEFGTAPFNNTTLTYLETAVKCGSDPGYTTLSPRQAVTYTPPTHDHWGQTWTGSGTANALQLSGGTGGLYAAGPSYGVYAVADSTSAHGLWGYASSPTGTTYGVYGVVNSAAGYGVFGYNSTTSVGGVGTYGQSDASYGVGVYGINTYTGSRGGFGVFGSSETRTGVYGTGIVGVTGQDRENPGGIGVAGSDIASTGDGKGVFGESSSNSGFGVYGYTQSTVGINYGVFGESSSVEGQGVHGLATAAEGRNYGMYGQSASVNGFGLYGEAYATNGQNFGVFGASNSDAGFGVVGRANSTTGMNYGVFGVSASPNGYGVYGYAESSSGEPVGVYGRAADTKLGWAGWFEGDVKVTGAVIGTGVISRIDHPLDPANQYLNQSFVESPEMLIIVNGISTMDQSGRAWVQLPDWFEDLTRDFRYQLTCVGDFAPVFIASGVQNNKFQIAGGQPGMQVSWQVTGVRHDPWAEANPMQVEQLKPANHAGTYLHPELYGQPAELGLSYKLANPPSILLPASTQPPELHLLDFELDSLVLLTLIPPTTPVSPQAPIPE